MVPAERYVEQLWAMLDKMLDYSKCGIGSDTLAVTHWTDNAKGLQSGLTICAQPRRILAQQLCERVKVLH